MGNNSSKLGIKPLMTSLLAMVHSAVSSHGIGKAWSTTPIPLGSTTRPKVRIQQFTRKSPAEGRQLPLKMQCAVY
jgi:hypothetical protein